MGLYHTKIRRDEWLAIGPDIFLKASLCGPGQQICLTIDAPARVHFGKMTIDEKSRIQDTTVIIPKMEM
jgi:hypothetical protein